MKSLTEVWEIVDRFCPPLAAEHVELSDALNRVLRENVAADTDQPPFSRSAMDGYLVRADETETILQLEGELPPGVDSQMPATGSALRVFTGSAVPEEGVAVVMQEEAQLEGNRVKLHSKPGMEYIRRRGQHAHRGDILVHAGNRLTPGRVALLASAGMNNPLVSPLVRTAHIVTGSELIDCGEIASKGQIRDSNSPMILSLLQQTGAKRVWHGHLDEAPLQLKMAIAESLKTDIHVLLVSGGASVGDHDHTRTVLHEMGFELLVDGVTCRPGKPLLIARKDGILAFGLPGNPMAHFVCFHLHVRRALSQLCGEAPIPCQQARLREAVPPHRSESWRPCHVTQKNAEITAHVLPWSDSSDLTELAQANGLLRVHLQGYQKGEVGEFFPI